MSLKAKIEAVIYASEEPVTLAQLAGLLGVEAQSELDRLDERQQTLALQGEEEAEADAADGIDAPAVAGVPDVADVPEPTEPAADAAEPAEAPRDEAVPADTSQETAAEKRTAKDLARNQERRLREYFRRILDELIADYATSERGLEIREVAGGLRMATKPEYHDAVRGFVKSLKPPLKLSLQALETLAVVAYKQPITAPEISEIRGVDSSGVLGSLMGRKLITTAGRKQVIGRPILYKTTKDFLLRFGLKDVQELPSIEEFEKMAGELADVEPMQKEIPMADVKEPISEEEMVAETMTREASDSVPAEPQADGDDTPVDTPVDAPDSPIDQEPDTREPDTVATPEGDNEYGPDEPLTPLPDGLQKTPAIDTNKV